MNEPKLPKHHTVRYKHLREEKPVHQGKMSEHGVVNERGGATYAFVRDASGRVVAIGEALCRADVRDEEGRLVEKGDQFNRRLGRTIALGRALKALKTKDETIRAVWSDSEHIKFVCETLDVPYDVRS